ncbi:MAG: SPFH domain-containing protein [Candidatus Azotimanducaceae bacterium]
MGASQGAVAGDDLAGRRSGRGRTLYFLGGIYQVDEQERGVVFRFGEVQPDLKTAGLQVVSPRFIDRVEPVNVTQVQSHNHQALMLTKDENIVDVSLTVQWVIDDAAAFLVRGSGAAKELKPGHRERICGMWAVRRP